MNNEEMPPWSSLPEEVRHRVSERMRHRYGSEDDQTTEQARQELRDLSASRLIDCYGLKKAMRKGRKYPGFGLDPQAWQAAALRCQQTIDRMSHDPLWIEKTAFLFALVKEELAHEKDRPEDHPGQ